MIPTPICVATILAITGKVAKLSTPNITAKANIKFKSVEINIKRIKVKARRKNINANNRGLFTWSASHENKITPIRLPTPCIPYAVEASTRVYPEEIA